MKRGKNKVAEAINYLLIAITVCLIAFAVNTYLDLGPDGQRTMQLGILVGALVVITIIRLFRSLSR